MFRIWQIYRQIYRGRLKYAASREDRELFRSSFLCWREDQRGEEEDQDQPWIIDRTRNTVRLNCVTFH